ncbi:hypothetical protein D3C87_2164510 [compost metagenome]
MSVPGVFQIRAVGRAISVNIRPGRTSYHQREEQIFERIPPFRVDICLQRFVDLKGIVRRLE